MSKIPRKQVDIVGIDANANMGLEQQSDVLGKWYYPAKRTSDNGERLVDSCEQTDLIISFMFDRNHRRYHIMWQGSINLTPEEQRKRKIKTLKLQLDYVLARDIPRSDIRKSRAVWDVAFDSDHRPVLLSFNTRFHKKNRGVPLQSTSQVRNTKNVERNSANVCLFMLDCGTGRSSAMRIPSQSASKALQGKRSRFYYRGRSLPFHRRKQNPRKILYVSPVLTSTRKSVLEGKLAESLGFTKTPHRQKEKMLSCP
ncbi:hypothetical protein RB195_022269 [Necator americanus]|uniref:Endonuclease/exonuclease/phosphatase domain-containing protein n=1 Tax=Necator americanus TaxID=51031 RepID=A0ABR1EEL5_NECAM